MNLKATKKMKHTIETRERMKYRLQVFDFPAIFPYFLLTKPPLQPPPSHNLQFQHVRRRSSKDPQVQAQPSPLP